MKGIIYCEKFETGLAEFKKLVESYKKIGIEVINKVNATTNTVSADFTNGDYWLVTKATDGAKSYTCNVAYIDRMINDDLVEKVIMPTIKAFPYQAFRYYNWGNWA